MAQPDLALRTTRNGLFSHYVVAGSKNPPPLGVGSVKVTAGLGIGILNLGLSLTGYIAPAADGSFVEQSMAVKNWCTFATFGFPAIAMAAIVVIFALFDLEKKLPQIHEDIKKRAAVTAEE